MKKLLLLLSAILGLAAATTGQSLQQKVTMKYSGEPLGQVLTDISQSYQVRFSYSPDFIPVDRKVSVQVKEQSLSYALDMICEQVPMRYASAGGQILLKPDRSKETKRLGQINTLKGKVRQTSPIYPEPVNKAERDRLKRNMSPLGKYEEHLVIEGSTGNDLKDINTGMYRLPADTLWEESYIWNDDRRLAQVSLLPYLGTNTDRSAEITNNVSFNVLWGTNGGVDGLEVGGLVNVVVNDVSGMQIAGLGNTIGGNLEGTQVGGLFNVNKGHTTGLQVAGLLNTTQKGHAVQLAGIANKSKGDYRGLQFSGLFNSSGGKAEGSQISGLFNYAYSNAGTQLSGLFNIAGDVSHGQISGLFNKGAYVNGAQLALINISDTITGTPIGLFNIVKKGYNRIEVSGNDALFANVGVKFGAHRLYNIIHAGARWDELKPGVADTAPGTYMSWGLGYGIGNTTALSPRLLMNFELVAIQINEQEYWTKSLNLLNQVRLSFDLHKPGKRLSVFAGPVGNVMLSRVVNPETGAIGSTVIQAPYTLLEATDSGTNVKFWLGLQGGIRF
jgi:hypothetical protein